MSDLLTVAAAERRPRALLLASAAALLLILAGGDRAGLPASAGAAAPTPPAPPANGEMGFFVVQFHAAYALGADDKVDCPDGRGSNLRESYLRTLPAAERERLSDKANETELDKKWKAYGAGPNGTNVCSNIYDFADRGPTPIMKGPVGRGFDLDEDQGKGSDDPYVCKHDNFTSPAGQTGIDNQYLRVIGCSAANRPSQADLVSAGPDAHMMAGDGMQVILLRGVDSLVNDPEVQLIYANTDDLPLMDATARPVFNATFGVAAGERKIAYRNVLRGRIVNGVLTTENKRILLSQDAAGITQSNIDLDRGRVRIEFQPDGTIRGMVGGYQPLLNDMKPQRTGGFGTVTIAGVNCAGLYNAQRILADGGRDPKTGQCNRLSYAFDLVGVPAFINDVQPARRIVGK